MGWSAVRGSGNLCVMVQRAAPGRRDARRGAIVNALLPLIVLAVLGATAWWVHADATRQADAGEPVVVTFGSFAIASPTAWAVGCIVAWVVVFPLYLVARRV